MKLQSVILYPFSKLYELVTTVRNKMYDQQIYRSVHFDIPVISVGNLTVGGTGKTPMVEYLLRLLKKDFRIATLSRGYGRKTKGFRLASEQDSARTIGDEPFQYFLKFHPEVEVSVGEERILAIPEIMSLRPQTQLIILDDAYQHRSVRPDLNLLLTDFNRPFYKDEVLPAGRLRESRKGAGRADAVIVTKCPDNLEEQDREAIRQEIGHYTRPQVPVFFAGIRYEKPLAVKGTAAEKLAEMPRDVLLLSGIARPELLESYVSGHFQLHEHMVFADHYVYTPADIARIRQHFEQIRAKHKAILVTEKDMARLLDEKVFSLITDLPVFYLPIAFYFPEGKEELGRLVRGVLPND